MNKPGRNDPCPCGSGKKYKKCCLPITKKLNDINLNDFYGTIKALNNQLIKRANLDDYEHASFTDAMDLAITSNALSLIKGFLQNNCCSITNQLNMRNILEHFVFLLMDKAGEISETQKELFNVQYMLIEYHCYEENIFCEQCFDRKEMTERYEKAVALYKKHGYTNEEIKRFQKTRAPFLCLEKFNFNELLKRFLPEQEQCYVFLSRKIHPSSYQNHPKNDFLITYALDILFLVFEHYKDVKIAEAEKARNFSFYREWARIYGPTAAQQLYDIQRSQWQILMDIADLLQNGTEEYIYLAEILKEASFVIHDINTDSQLGYVENPKLKFKVIAEFFACFDRTYPHLIPEKSIAALNLMRAHEIYKDYEADKQEAPQGLLDAAFEDFQTIFPESSVAQNKFEKSFRRPNGFLLDESAKAISFSKLVFDYIKKLCHPEQIVIINGEKVDLEKWYMTLYLESQYMSHGCGYLYFANAGAWNEDLNVISFLDLALLKMLSDLNALWQTCSIFDKQNAPFAEVLGKAFNEMKELIEKKREIIKNNPRVPKTF